MLGPCTMGATMAARLAFLLALLLGSDALRCDWGYEGHSSGPSPFDGRFVLNVSVDVTGYRANAEYDVTLQGQRKGMMTEKFIGFLIVAENEDASDASSNEKKAGSFQIVGDSLTKYSDRCQNAVTQTSFMPKPEIQVLWIAPPSGSGCVTIKATVVEHRDVWYMDDTALSKTICEDMSQGSSHEQPPILSKCCACFEAKYEVTFEGLWSRHTHPKDFPPNGWSTRFSDIIGASHTADYSFWKYDERASEGLRELAEHGSTNKLERELKGQSTSIRTIIKARGISYPNLTGKTFAVLRVTNEHHLMSLVSRIDPSPDWIVGISGLELCLESCTWIESMVWDLYPWDIGTDSGITYTASNHPTVPPDVIHRIGPDFPKNPESPFYDPSGKEMKPMARINITRQRLYEKNCNESSTGDSSGENSPCALTSWGAWSECSSTCGEGMSLRQRSFRNAQLAESARCPQRLTDSKKCFGPRRSCSLDKNDPSTPANCPVSEWSEWSPCSVTCGSGKRDRIREIIQESEPSPVREDVNQNLLFSTTIDEAVYDDNDDTNILTPKENNNDDENSADNCVGVELRETVDCNGTYSSCDISESDSRSNIYNGKIQVGNQLIGRIENKKIPESHTKARDPDEDNGDEPDESVDKRPTSNRFGNKKPHIHNGRHSSGHSGSNHNSHRKPDDQEYVMVEKIHGNVRDCRVSEWTEWNPCSATCGLGYEERSRTILHDAWNGGRKCPSHLLQKRRCNMGSCHHRENSNSNRNPVSPPYYGGRDKFRNRDCELDEWSAWSPCTETCGPRAVKQRTRKILQAPTGNGARCEDRIETVNCELMPCIFED